MLPSFLTRPVLRLRPEGGTEAPGPREPALGRRTVWLARGLCRFERVRAPAGLAGRAARAAARVHARTRAPFARAAYRLARTADGGYAVWWWDAAEVERLLAEAGLWEDVRLAPEAAGQAVGADGWRVLREGGFEAQLWAGGSLEHSAWRRAAFDAAAWRGLARLSDATDDAGPPPARPPVFTAASPYARRLVAEFDGRAALPGAALALLTLSLGASAVFAGQGLAVSRRDSALRTEIAAREAVALRSRRPELAARARGLDALGRVVDRPGPLSRLLEAQRVLARFGLRVTGFDAGRDELAVSVPATAAAGVDLLVEELQAQPGFADVRPTLDREARTLTLRMRLVG